MKPAYVALNIYEHPNKHTFDCQVFFRCGETVRCKPPFVKGNVDSTWRAFADKKDIPAITNKQAWELKIGMALLPYTPERT
jgi:hypothetical protein